MVTVEGQFRANVRPCDRSRGTQSRRESNHERLIVWRRSIELVVETYRVTALLPASERFGLVTQMRRAAVSIAANITEGHARDGLADYLRMLSGLQRSLRQKQGAVPRPEP